MKKMKTVDAGDGRVFVDEACQGGPLRPGVASHVLWLVQTNMGSSSDIQKYVSAIRESGALVQEVDCPPMSGELPEVGHDGPVVVYGSVSFVAAASESGRWTPGVCASADVFTYENWTKNYGELLLNDAASTERTTVGLFAESSRPGDEDVFVRPEADSKAFAGGVSTAGAFKAWCRLVARAGDFFGVNADTPVIVGRPYGIEAEWRLFVCGGVVVGASLYKSRGRPRMSEGAPQVVLEFAKKAIKRWDPAPVYVLDVCLSGGNPYIVESQGFNSAGQYATDMVAVVVAINQSAERAWLAKRAKMDKKNKP